LRPLFLRRLPLHLLLRPALPERGHRQQPSDQRFLGRGILDVGKHETYFTLRLPDYHYGALVIRSAKTSTARSVLRGYEYRDPRWGCSAWNSACRFRSSIHGSDEILQAFLILPHQVFGPLQEFFRSWIAECHR